MEQDSGEPRESGEARAERLHREIDELIRDGRAGEESPREFIHRRMSELDDEDPDEDSDHR